MRPGAVGPHRTVPSALHRERKVVVLLQHLIDQSTRYVNVRECSFRGIFQAFSYCPFGQPARANFRAEINTF
jgi:hypothetical protein